MPCEAYIALHTFIVVPMLSTHDALLQVKLESIGPEDVVDGKEELILGLLWTMILRFSISEVQEEVNVVIYKQSIIICIKHIKYYAQTKKIYILHFYYLFNFLIFTCVQYLCQSCYYI